MIQPLAWKLTYATDSGPKRRRRERREKGEKKGRKEGKKYTTSVVQESGQNLTVSSAQGPTVCSQVVSQG